MATAPSFAATPRTTVTLLTTANTNRDGTGSPVACFAAGSSGSRVERINIKATGTTAAGCIVLYIYDGTTARAYREINVTAITASTTVASFEYQLQLGLSIQSGYSIYASTQVTNNFVVSVEGADY